MKAAVYARVSTQEGRQHLENQLKQLRAYAKRMRWSITATFTDQASGAKDNRPGFEQMMHEAAGKAFDVLLVYDLSRMTRQGPAAAFRYIERLKASGVEFHSFREEYFRTTGAAGPMLVAIAAYIAQEERRQMQDRINAGLARARSAGVQLGRPRKVIDRARLTELRKQGKSIRQIAAKLKTSPSIVMRAVQGK
jgi:DNA invertase Pin-like site-specific DNA recombinase